MSEHREHTAPKTIIETASSRGRRQTGTPPGTTRPGGGG